MNPALRHRLNGILAARRARAGLESREDQLRRERRRLIGETARLASDLEAAVAEINDALEAGDLRLRIDPSPDLAAAAEVFRIGVDAPEGADDLLDVAVDPEGLVHALIQEAGGGRRAIGAVRVEAVDRDRLSEWLIELLERRHGSPPRG